MSVIYFLLSRLSRWRTQVNSSHFYGLLGTDSYAVTIRQPSARRSGARNAKMVVIQLYLAQLRAALGQKGSVTALDDNWSRLRDHMVQHFQALAHLSKTELRMEVTGTQELYSLTLFVIDMMASCAQGSTNGADTISAHCLSMARLAQNVSPTAQPKLAQHLRHCLELAAYGAQSSALQQHLGRKNLVEPTRRHGTCMKAFVTRSHLPSSLTFDQRIQRELEQKMLYIGMDGHVIIPPPPPVLVPCRAY
jgi:hypothetical protein